MDAIRTHPGIVGRLLLTALVLAALLLLAVSSASATDGARRYVAPITSPVFNETPYITTEVRPIYMYNAIPDEFVTDGGEIHMVAVQLRAAITERLAFIATKDGWADVDFDAALPDEEGFANIAAGLKYAVVYDPEDETFVTLGLRYEAPVGDLESAGIRFQGGGDGFLDAFVTAATTAGDRIGVQGSFGYDAAIDMSYDSSFIHASVHGDIETVRSLFGVLEMNLLTTVDDGDRLDASAVGSFEGFDLVNFGNTDSGTVVTIGFGGRWCPTEHVQVGIAYEVPLTDREDIIDERVTLDAVFSL